MNGASSAPFSFVGREPLGIRFPLWGVSPWLVLMLVVTGCVSSPDVFEVHRKQAVKDSRTPEARAYEREFYPAIGQDLANLLKKCTTEFPAAEINSFELVFKVDHWGEPKAVLVNPVTDVSNCVAGGRIRPRSARRISTCSGSRPTSTCSTLDAGRASSPARRHDESDRTEGWSPLTPAR